MPQKMKTKSKPAKLTEAEKSLRGARIECLSLAISVCRDEREIILQLAKKMIKFVETGE